MTVRRMDALSDWDDWSDGDPEWWLRHPLHHPRRGSVGSQPFYKNSLAKKAKKSTLA
jgi:hypothetical protein